jgi:hypothetical protein
MSSQGRYRPGGTPGRPQNQTGPWAAQDTTRYTNEVDIIKAFIKESTKGPPV